MTPQYHETSIGGQYDWEETRVGVPADTYEQVPDDTVVESEFRATSESSDIDRRATLYQSGHLVLEIGSPDPDVLVLDGFRYENTTEFLADWNDSTDELIRENEEDRE